MAGIFSKRQFHALRWFLQTQSILARQQEALDSNPDSTLILDFGHQILKPTIWAKLKFLTSKKVDSDGRLGKRFERIFHAWLTAKGWPVVSNVQFQIPPQPQTQSQGQSSELDFVVADTALKKLIHIEVACKFYIYFSQSSANGKWIGPRGRDSLVEKYAKLVNKQTRQLEYRAAREEVDRLFLKQGIDTRDYAVQRAIYLAGQLFLPWADTNLKAVRSQEPLLNQHLTLGRFYLIDEQMLQALVQPKKTKWTFLLEQELGLSFPLEVAFKAYWVPEQRWIKINNASEFCRLIAATAHAFPLFVRACRNPKDIILLGLKFLKT